VPDGLVNVRYMVSSAAPAFADVVRGNLRLLLAADVERLRAAGLTFRNEIIRGPGGQQVLLDDPSGNPMELFQPADA
jgi:hypothetical protein